MRLILLITALFLLIFIARKLLQAKNSQQGFDDAKRLKKVVPCAICDLHIPLGEAVPHKDHYFCCEDHLQTWRNSND